MWRGLYRPDPVQAKTFVSYLSDEEKNRAQRFVKASIGDRFIFAHGMLRSILGHYIGCPPRHITFNNNAYGKPALAGPIGAGDVRFSLAHSGDAVLVALSRSNELGVDVELMRAVPDVHLIISRNFSMEEQYYIRSLPEDLLQRAFFIQWTLKEAFIKGIGSGLSYPLEDFTVAPQASRREIGDLYTVKPKSGPHWQCLLLSPFPGYVGALAAETIFEHPVLWHYHTLT